MKYDENINRWRYSSHRIQCNTFTVFLSNFRLCSKTVRKVITVVSYYVTMCSFPEDVLCLRCEKPRPPFLWCVVLTLSPPSGCQWLPRGEYSRGEGQPAGWYPHLHRHDSSQRSRGQNAPPQGRLGDWEITRHTNGTRDWNSGVCAAQVGDRIVSINGRSVDGLSHGEVVTMLKNSYGNISLQVTHCSEVTAVLQYFQFMILLHHIIDLLYKSRTFKTWCVKNKSN